MTMSNVTITAETWHEVVALRDALSDYRRTWIDLIRDCEEGKRPNMSLEGARMVLADIEALMVKAGNQSA